MVLATVMKFRGKDTPSVIEKQISFFKVTSVIDIRV